jgi:delta 1-pyrroline-5-carboxylate dehydrogenase
MSIFPPGVLQVLSGDDNLGPWMTSHPGIDMISFTGSIPTGKRVASSCAASLKRYVLELTRGVEVLVAGSTFLQPCHEWGRHTFRLEAL